MEPKDNRLAPGRRWVLALTSAPSGPDSGCCPAGSC